MKKNLLLGVLLSLAVAAGLYFWLQAPVERPNVLLITVDTLRADHLGAYGYDRPTSPNIDSLAGESIVFDNAFTHATQSTPSHATILTSRHPGAHGVVRNGFSLKDGNLTLAEVLRAAGYQTGMFVSHLLVSRTFGLGQGFDVSENLQVDTHGHNHPGENFRHRTPVAVFDAAIAWLGRARSEPFFVWLHLQHPHESYEPPEPFDRMFGPIPQGGQAVRCVRLLDAYRRGQIELNDALIDYAVDLYDGEIAYVDDQLGRLLAELDGNTVIVLTADHGEMLFDDPDRRANGHASYRTDPVLRVPLLIRAPGKEPARVRSLAGLIDVAPTILDLAGLRVPDVFEGRSLVPLIEGDRASVRDSILLHTERDDRTQLALRTTEHKLVCDVTAEGWSCRMFDLRTDPHERTDRIGEPEQAARVAALRRELRERFAATVAAGFSGRDQELGEAVRDMLRRAGYLKED